MYFFCFLKRNDRYVVPFEEFDFTKFVNADIVSAAGIDEKEFYYPLGFGPIFKIV